MTLLNGADRVYLGATQVDRAYLGTTQVFSNEVTYTDISHLMTASLDGGAYSIGTLTPVRPWA